LLESFDPSRGGGEPGDKMSPGGVKDGIRTGLQSVEEVEDISLDIEFWLSPSSLASPFSTSSSFDHLSTEDGSLGSSLSSSSTEALGISSSISDESNKSLFEGRWLCDFPNCGQVFSKQHDRK
jgi:hypothetical protein